MFVKMRYMSRRKVILGEKHHWWPQSLSKYWANERGLIHRINHEGVVQKIPPKKIARITNGHNFVFKDSPLLNATFEHDFDQADRDFPPIIESFEELRIIHEKEIPKTKNNHIHTQSCNNELFERILACLVSLVVRSPKFRNSAKQSITLFRKNINSTELKQLISLNIGSKYKEITRFLGSKGKLIFFFSLSREFIFGDGFYHNVPLGGVKNSYDVRFLIPLLPNISVLYIRPWQYTPEPRIFTLWADKELTSLMNDTIQIYSNEYLFYKSNKPELIDSFIQKEHCIFDGYDPIDQLINNIPGIRQSLF